MTLSARFGLALQQARKKKGLTQEDFSNVSSRTYLSTLERGLKSPTIEKIEQISSVLKIHPMTLLALAYTNKNEKNFEALSRQISSEFKRLIE